MWRRERGVLTWPRRIARPLGRKSWTAFGLRPSLAHGKSRGLLVRERMGGGFRALLRISLRRWLWRTCYPMGVARVVSTLAGAHMAMSVRWADARRRCGGNAIRGSQTRSDERDGSEAARPPESRPWSSDLRRLVNEAANRYRDRDPMADPAASPPPHVAQRFAARPSCGRRCAALRAIRGDHGRQTWGAPQMRTPWTDEMARRLPRRIQPWWVSDLAGSPCWGSAGSICTDVGPPCPMRAPSAAWLSNASFRGCPCQGP